MSRRRSRADDGDAAAGDGPAEPATEPATAPLPTRRRPPTHERAVDGLPTIEQLLRGATIGTAVFVVAAALSAALPDWFAWLGGRWRIVPILSSTFCST